MTAAIPADPIADASADVVVVNVSKQFDSQRALDQATLRAEPGSVLALLGPSGCGKTTLLRVVAGLEQPDAGEVRVGGRVLTAPGVLVAPERRRVGMVFQDWALFPHLSVGDNVAYGLPRTERRGSSRVAGALAMVGLSGFEQRRPATLSGGQQQRVALARALAPRPAVLLLDEPFSNLDAALRVQVRTEMHQLLAELGVTTLFVTHDQEEAFVLGDAVAVMTDGRMVQQGTPAEIYDNPVSPWVAAFVGDANLLAGEASGPEAATVMGRVPLRAPMRGSVTVLVRPEEVTLRYDGAAEVCVVEYHGHDTVYVVDVGTAMLRSRVAGPPRFGRGDRVTMCHDGAAATAWPQTPISEPNTL